MFGTRFSRDASPWKNPTYRKSSLSSVPQRLRFGLLLPSSYQECTLRFGHRSRDSLALVIRRRSKRAYAQYPRDSAGTSSRNLPHLEFSYLPKEIVRRTRKPTFMRVVTLRKIDKRAASVRSTNRNRRVVRNQLHIEKHSDTSFRLWPNLLL